MVERCGDPRGKKYVLTWAWHPKSLPVATPHSQLLSAADLGMDVTLLRPDGWGLDPEVVDAARERTEALGGSLTETDDQEAAYSGAHVVCAKAWGSLDYYGRFEDEAADKEGLRASWMVDEDKMARTDSGSFLHCLPVRRNVVVSDGVLNSKASAVIDEAENRLWTAAAVFCAPRRIVVSPAPEGAESIEVREARPDEDHLAAAAAALIDASAEEHDIARRTPEWLAKKIRAGKAAVALRDGELVGFGYWSDWEGGRFVSHSGLVVRSDLRGHGLGGRLKRVLVDSSRAALPRATLMSLTTSEAVKRMNLAYGFRVVPLDRLTDDPAFWEGCKTCRNYAEVQARGERCCCEGMILEPDP